MPFVQQNKAILNHQSMDSANLGRSESYVTSQCHRVQPEFRRLIVSIHMNAGRLVRFVAIENMR